ncbi:MAG: DUF2911 domain-containing protein [Terriglobales bacterium]
MQRNTSDFDNRTINNKQIGRGKYIVVLTAILSLGCSMIIAKRCIAQTVLQLPEASQRARVLQMIGISDVVISYHRPLVNGRQIWGQIVPYGQVWRAGANENTSIQFSDAVEIEGKPLPKGTYGLHMIPGKSDWIIIFSKNSTSWGSFTYDPSEDALRVMVKPHQSEFHEALTFQFDDIRPESAQITLLWDRLAVSFKASVNVREIVERSLQDQLRDRSGDFLWNAWNEAAEYLLTNKGNLDQALRYSNRSIQMEERFENMTTKARILDAMGRREEADAAREQAIVIATPVQLHIYGRRLQLRRKQEQAFQIFRMNVKKYPAHWAAHQDAARLACAQGDFDTAVREMRLALAGSPELSKPAIETLVKQLEAKRNINEE